MLSHSSLNGEILRDLLSSPETLALDFRRSRLNILDRTIKDSLGRTLNAGPKDDQKIEKYLASRVSRASALHEVIPELVFSLPEKELGALRTRIEVAVNLLGTWTQDTIDWSSPRFMASHALRLISRDNYEFVIMKDALGNEHKGWNYKFPVGQEKWRTERRVELVAESSKFNRQTAIRTAMDNENKTTNMGVADAKMVLDETAAAILDGEKTTHNPTDAWFARVSAAAFLTRFGSPEDVTRHRSEIISIFEQTLQLRNRLIDFSSNGVMFDVIAMAITGRLYLAATSGNEAEAVNLLKDAGAFPQNTALAFLNHGTAANELNAINDKLLVSIIRVALVGCMIPQGVQYDEDTVAYDKRCDNLEKIIKSRIESERQWLKGSVEPNWPIPPLRYLEPSPMVAKNAVAEKLTLRERELPDYDFDERTGSNWLRILEHFASSTETISELVMRANRDWLLKTNEPREDGEDNDYSDRFWTRGLMGYVAAYARHWPDEVRQELIFEVLLSFSDEDFLDAAETFLVKSDCRHIEGDAGDREYLLSVRETIWQRLQKTLHWRDHVCRSRGRMEMYLERLVSAFYMRPTNGLGDGACYAESLSDSDLTPFLPILSEISSEAPSCPTIARLYLNILEHLDPSIAENALVVSAERWAKDASNRFWNEIGIGRRVLAIGQKAKNLTNKAAWGVICESLIEAGVTVEYEFLERTRENEYR